MGWKREALVGAGAGAAAALAALGSPPAVAADARETDLRCLAAFAARAGSASDDTTKNQATIGVIYYLGRVDGEAPQTDLQAELQRLGNTMSDADLTSTLGPCAQRLGQRGQVLTKIGENLSGKKP